MSDPLWVSHTAMGDLAQCEQRYAYRYVDRLKPVEKSPAPELGILLHSYLELYYMWLRDKQVNDPIDAHVEAQSIVLASEGPKLKQMAQLVWQTGAEDVAQKFLDMPEQFKYMTDRYHILRGRPDFEQYTVLLVEEPVQLELLHGNGSAESIWISAKIDLVLAERDTGRILLVEHKNPIRIPYDTVRLRDLQTVLYAGLLYAKTYPTGAPIVVDEIVWNYMCQTPPSIPNQLKSGGLSRDKRMNTTWAVYAGEIQRLGLAVGDYADMYDALKDKEEKEFYPRFQVPMVVNRDYMILNFIEQAKKARYLRQQWAKGETSPIRVLSRSCDFCPYNKLCTTFITGGDIEDVIDEHFQRPLKQQELPLEQVEPQQQGMEIGSPLWKLHMQEVIGEYLKRSQQSQAAANKAIGGLLGAAD